MNKKGLYLILILIGAVVYILCDVVDGSWQLWFNRNMSYAPYKTDFLMPWFAYLSVIFFISPIMIEYVIRKGIEDWR